VVHEEDELLTFQILVEDVHTPNSCGRLVEERRVVFLMVF